MDHVLPTGMSRLGIDPQIVAAPASRHAVEAEGRRHPIVAFTSHGFVLAAEPGRLRLRGFVDILDGETRVARRLVLCAWQENGLIGFEFKRDQPGRPVAPDYVPAERSTESLAG